MQKTYYPKPGDVTKSWYLVDATDQNLGRMATRIAQVLLGKNKPQFTPGVDLGDFVIVINAEKVTVTGNKLDDKFYYRYSGYPGGMKSVNLRNQLAKFPDRVIKSAVWGMLPHNRHGRRIMKNLRIYAGAQHPHAAQKPEKLDLD
ncbi:MAG: 50S ribosomal protein L13 [Anaerolineales bacterium]